MDLHFPPIFYVYRLLTTTFDTLPIYRLRESIINPNLTDDISDRDHLLFNCRDLSFLPLQKGIQTICVVCVLLPGYTAE